MTRALNWDDVPILHHTAHPPARVAAERVRSISVCLPARDEAATIGTILADIMPLREQGVIDQVVVVDDSSDGTGEIAAAAGAEVYDQSSLMPSYGPVDGKGDAMWRALSVLEGEIVCFLDADSEQFGPHYVSGLVGPVAGPAGAHLTKAFYRRPWSMSGVELPEGGGRVTELTARPVLERFFPELASFRQPLAGELAARRELLDELAFICGYGVDIALLIDAWRAVGLSGLVQVDLDVRQNRHRPLSELSPMAGAVLDAALSRAGILPLSAAQRPPFGETRSALSAAATRA